VNADTLVKLLPQAAAGGRLKLVNDGGFLLDFDDPAYRLAPATVPVQTLLEQNYDLWGSSLNSLCEQAMANAGAHPGSCFMTTVVHPYIVNPPPGGLGLPLFIQVSTIDVPATQGHGIDNPSDPNDVAALETWRAQTLASLQGIEWVFSVGRPFHTLLTRDDSRNGWNMGPRGNTFREVLTRFWEGSSPERAVFMNPGP
jgi:hypothetical protein